MPSNKITDHDTQAIARLPGYESSGTVWGQLLRAFIGSVQDAEDTLDDLVLLRAISTAEGQQLDDLGTFLLTPRPSGLSDADYADLLRTTPVLLYRSGEIETLLETYLELTGADFVQLTEIQPATVQLTASSGSSTPVSLDQYIIDQMQAYKAAGVQLILQFVNLDAFELSRHADTDVNGNGPTSATNGLGSEDAGQTDGGVLARTI